MAAAVPAKVSDLTRQLAAYIATAGRKALPKQVQERTKHHVLDTLSAMLSGSQLLPGKVAIAHARSMGGKTECTVVGSNIVTNALNAALANGMLGHADETDDSHAGSITHPGCAVVPAALAMAQRERRDGTSFLRAVALGYDIGCRMGFALRSVPFKELGHSPHSMAPTFGAAAAGASLARLKENQVRYVLSYAAQQASGVSCYMGDRDHIEKAFDFGGMPARNGVTAATLVAVGGTAVDDPFSGERNFFIANDESKRMGKAPQPEMLVWELGRTFEVMNTNIKRWSVGSPIQAPLDSLVELIREHGIRAQDVEAMTVRVWHAAANTTNNRDMPDICMQYMCAVMLIDGTASFDSAHDVKRMKDKKVRALWERITVVGDDEIESLRPQRQGIVELKLKDGRELRHRTHAVRGSAQNPMTREHVEEKCLGLIEPIIGKRRARRLCDAVWDLERVRDLRELQPLLQVR